MTTLRMRAVLVLAIASLSLPAVSAAGQQDVPATGGRVYGLVGGGFGDGRFVATGAGAGLRLTPHLGLDVELTHLSGRGETGATASGATAFGGISVFSGVTFTAGAALEDYPPLGAGDYPFPFVSFEDEGRDVTTFLTKFTVEFPIAHGRLFPYLTGGGGIGRVTERFSVVVDPVPWVPGRAGGTAHADGTLHFSDTGIFPRSSPYSELGLGLVLGGGVDVRLWRGLGAGVDIRWLRILRNYDALDTVRVTARASYRF